VENEEKKENSWISEYWKLKSRSSFLFFLFVFGSACRWSRVREKTKPKESSKIPPMTD
jgi:hypothetical protein